jgi:Fe-S-cluster-containing dehydrogenase component
LSAYRIVQNLERCIGCHACEVHCIINKGITSGIKICEILSSEIKIVKNKAIQKFYFVTCFHCGRPPCVEACPTGAMQKRKKDGIVFVDKSLCIGCKNCIEACPWGIPQYNPEGGTIIKCDLCMDRIDQGLEPACVTKCTTHALRLSNTKELSFEKKKKLLK